MAISCGGQSERIENFAVSPTRVQWYVAETKGFEPSRPFRVCALSRGVPSTTRPRLRLPVYRGVSAGASGKVAVCGAAEKASVPPWPALAFQ